MVRPGSAQHMLERFSHWVVLEKVARLIFCDFEVLSDFFGRVSECLQFSGRRWSYADMTTPPLYWVSVNGWDCVVME